MINNILSRIQSIFRENIRTRNDMRKLLLLVAGLLLVIVVAKYGWSKYHSYSQELEQQIEIKTMQYNRLAKLVSRSQQFKELNKSLTDFKKDFIGKRFMQAATPGLSEAKFQNTVNQMAEKTNVNILSMRMLPQDEGRNFNTLKMGINCRAEIGAITDFLKEVHQSPRFLFFDEFDIKRVNRREERFFNFQAQLSTWTET